MHFGEDNVKASIQSMHLQDLKPGPRTRGLSLGSACARYRSWRIPPPTWLVPHEPSESMLQFPWHADYKCGRANKTVLAGKRSGTLKLASVCSAPSDAKPRRRTGSPFSSRGRRAGALLLSSFEIGASVCVGELLVWCRGGWPRFSEDRQNRAGNEEQGEHAQERVVRCQAVTAVICAAKAPRAVRMS